MKEKRYQLYISTMPAVVTTRRQATLGAYHAARTAQISRIRRRHPMTLGASGGAQIAESAGVSAATVAVAAIPIVGPFIAPLIGPIAGMFTKHHAQAVAVEGQTLNANNPNFLVTAQQTMAALQAGSISESQAIAALQQALSDYYASVASIIKHNGPCTPNCSYLPGSNCNKLSSCNAACVIGCINANSVAALTQMINSGGGSYTIPATPNNGAIQGTPSFTVTYSRGAIGSLTSSSLGGMPSWIWIAGGGVLLLFLFMGSKS